MKIMSAKKDQARINTLFYDIDKDQKVVNSERGTYFIQKRQYMDLLCKIFQDKNAEINKVYMERAKIMQKEQSNYNEIKMFLQS